MTERLKYELPLLGPSCVACRHWQRIEEGSAMGICSANLVPSSRQAGAVSGLITLDLQACSKWEEAK